MPSAALDAAVDQVRAVFAGASSPFEVGCSMCHPREWTALLRTPDAPIPAEAVEMYAQEVDDHFDDFAASMRRLLPDLVRQLAAGGSRAASGFGIRALGRVDWPAQPAHESAAVLGFFRAWWLDTLRSTEPLHPVDDVFQTCVTATRTVTPYLAAWAEQEPGGPAEAHLHEFLDHHHLDLVNEDEHIISWWMDHDRPKPLPEIITWVREHAGERIRAQGAAPDLQEKLDLLRLPVGEERWAAYEARFLT
ncbi:hypothetical protein [Streptomyces mesophilus]|uniref:hypothetical protein n=1 Tax=Streptomyces mesophilus TaxID=1775132 RepID=UPI003316C0EF